MREPGALRVLITNRTLASRTGTELYVRDLAAALLERGHTPIVYSPLLGALARDIRATTVAVTSDLATIAEPPDVIHGHHGPESLAALLAFPGVPAVGVCHSWVNWVEAPLRFPRVRRYVAVDQTCRDRLCHEHGIPPDRVHVCLNSVDLGRFRAGPPRAARPRRALVFSNAAGSHGSHLEPIQQVCAEEGIALEVAGWASGRSLERPEDVLGEFDLVFAKAKAAIEAMASGAAVILCDKVGAGPMVTMGEFDHLRALNFGMRTLRHPVTVPILRHEIARYDASDAAAVSRAIRATAGRDAMVDDLCTLYETVIAEQRDAPPADLSDEMRAAAAYVQSLSPRLYQRDVLRGVLLRLLRLPVVGPGLRMLGERAVNRNAIAFLHRLEEED